ncbi:Na(+)/H(+) exchange regulatory cofactor NHE-RF1a [Denticeps clupeoides]|uniref:Na(+)/H(+) exchange regulatory cofactor NHE-RF1a n=1 Tax=Denticeps clupeoides TaxID=299321 RepID=UPI0010A3E300|nr:Na(+)/H(+) exchange regulatory cofactor NHE-RF1-like [Denticeps clupeoides]
MSGDLRPRLCTLEKGSDGYGFHLHGEKSKPGQFIRLVEPDSPAAASGLLAGDRLAFVNGEDVEGLSHQQVVSRIKAATGRLELVVLDAATAELLSKRQLKCRKEYAADGIPVPGGEEADAEPSLQRLSLSSKESKGELRPRLCHIKKEATGYGFNLHSEKSKPGQYIRAVDEDSPAKKSGLRPQDKIIRVNGASVQGMQHSEVVAAIKAGGDETRLLVVDPDTDAFFRSCQVLPTEEHLTGPLPEPMTNGASDKEVNGKTVTVAEVQQEREPESKSQATVSPSHSNASVSSSNTASSSTPPPEKKTVENELVPDAGLGLNVSLQQAKERAHQKRSNKRAPSMEWSKRNELFSNL